MSDRDVLQGFLNGEAAASRRVEGWVRRVVQFRGYFIPADERDDVVQEALASVWRTLSRAESQLPDNFGGFVRRVAHRRCVDWMRNLRPTIELTDAVADPRPNPYDDLLNKDPVARVRWLLHALDPRCRELFRMHHLEHIKFREIAARLGTAEATQRVHMLNCVRKARELLAHWETSPRG
jgi:RNA polymerase sigma-70 factor (ECF subfamily)